MEGVVKRVRRDAAPTEVRLVLQLIWPFLVHEEDWVQRRKLYQKLREVCRTFAYYPLFERENALVLETSIFETMWRLSELKKKTMIVSNRKRVWVQQESLVPGVVMIIRMFQCTSFMGRNQLCNVVAFAPKSLSELMLFVHWLFDRPIDPENEIQYLIAPAWKLPASCKIGLLIDDIEKEKFLKQRALGRLKKLGLTSPIEEGFQRGAMQETSLSWFMHTCDTSGAKDKQKQTPYERIDRFVRGWFTPRPWKVTDAECANEIRLLAENV